MTNPRLIVLEEEEVERLREVDATLQLAMMPTYARLVRSLVARYEDGITRDEANEAADALMIAVGEWGDLDFPSTIHKLRDITPPTQRSDSE